MLDKFRPHDIHRCAKTSSIFRHANHRSLLPHLFRQHSDRQNSSIRRHRLLLHEPRLSGKRPRRHQRNNTAGLRRSSHRRSAEPYPGDSAQKTSFYGASILRADLANLQVWPLKQLLFTPQVQNSRWVLYINPIAQPPSSFDRSVAASIASWKISRKPLSSNTFRASAVVPPGEVTFILSCSGASSPSASSIAEPSKV